MVQDDSQGLVHAFVLDGCGGARSIGFSQLAEPLAEGESLFANQDVHFNLGNGVEATADKHAPIN